METSEIDDDDPVNYSIIEREEETEDHNINQPFDPKKIRVDTKTLTIYLVLERIKHGEINLTPDFQRNEVWTSKAKSLLIESILIRIPLPAFYMDATNDDNWLVIDGLQRLTALKQFIIDKTLSLVDVEYLEDFKNYKFDQLPRNFQRRIEEAQITVFLIEKGTPPEVKFNIFKRINTGGLPLSKQEIRHAIYQGKATEFLNKLANLKEFKNTLEIPIDNNQDNSEITELPKLTKRMEDQEFILRFLAFKLTSYQDYKSDALDSFLNDAMKKINALDDAKLDSLEKDFLKAFDAAKCLFGIHAFRKRSQHQPNRKFPLNKALFDSWSVILSKCNEQELATLKDKKDILNQKFIELLETDKSFVTSLTQGTGKSTYVKHRFSSIENLVKEVLSDDK